MAVLKRFSYDNIVEHNPTAPDPVDYDGGGGSGGETPARIIPGGTISVAYTGALTSGQTFVELNDFDYPMENPDFLLYVPICVLNNIKYGGLKDYFSGYAIRYDTSTGTPNGITVYLSGVTSNVPSGYETFSANGYVVYVYVGE